MVIGWKRAGTAREPEPEQWAAELARQQDVGAMPWVPARAVVEEPVAEAKVTPVALAMAPTEVSEPA
jgi:hypothetical protein